MVKVFGESVQCRGLFSLLSITGSCDAGPSFDTRLGASLTRSSGKRFGGGKQPQIPLAEPYTPSVLIAMRR